MKNKIERGTRHTGSPYEMADVANLEECKKTINQLNISLNQVPRAGTIRKNENLFNTDVSLNIHEGEKGGPVKVNVSDVRQDERSESPILPEGAHTDGEEEKIQVVEDTHELTIVEECNLLSNVSDCNNEDNSIVLGGMLEPTKSADYKATVNEESIAEHEVEEVSPSIKEELDDLAESPSQKSLSPQKDAQENKEKNWSTLTSFLSLFQVIKPGSLPNYKFTKNSESQIQKFNSAIKYQDNFVNKRLSCCPFGSPHAEDKVVQSLKSEPLKCHSTKVAVVNISPKPKSKGLSPSQLSSESLEAGGSSSATGSSAEEAASSSSSSGGGASPVITWNSSLVKEISSQVSSCNGIKESSSIYENMDVHRPFLNLSITTLSKLKLIHEGDISVCFLNHSKTVIGKVLTSKFLRCWETHHIFLQEDVISSKTPSGILKSPVSYSNVEDVYIVGRWEQTNQLCVRLVLTEGSIILQASSPTVRDQWLSSILWKKNMHKCRSILQSSTRPEVILKEIKNLVHSTLDSPLQDDSIISVPTEIISNVLMEKEMWTDRERREKVILALVPLLDKTTPSPEMFQFFSQHCLLNPRSQVVIDVFSPVVQQILKRTYDFGKSHHMGKFVADYMTALHSQNNGDEVIRKFLLSLHGPNFDCPHPRVLQNLVAVNLAAIFSHFEQKRTLLTESGNEENCSQAVHHLDRKLKCHIIVFRVISEFEDWRPGLAQLLQPIPFPDDALSCEFFMEGFTPVMKSIGTDTRCEVHEMILGIREDKGGWLNVYCPSGLACRDEGELWCRMLETLISCCCRRKSFLQKMMKHLGALILVALRGYDIAQEILCLMLEWRIVNGEEQEMQVVTALESTENGREKYGELSKRQEHLRQLQKKRGPRKLTLPSRSTDVDVAQLLSSGSFGNLECLSLAFTHVTSSCAHQLIQLPTLRCLNLWATHFGDAGLVVIAEHLDKLQVLNLCETPVTDKGISALASMKNLKKLNLNSTKLSPQTLETLKQKLPALQELDVRYTDAW